MKVKLSTIYASPHLTAQPGSVIDVSDEEGKQLIEGRFGIAAETAAVAPATETEVPAAGAETATTVAPEKRSGRGSRGRTSAAVAPATET